jgi:hypothetical protein
MDASERADLEAAIAKLLASQVGTPEAPALLHRLDQPLRTGARLLKTVNHRTYECIHRIYLAGCLRMGAEN